MAYFGCSTAFFAIRVGAVGLLKAADKGCMAKF
jgi:hypothetical protein